MNLAFNPARILSRLVLTAMAAVLGAAVLYVVLAQYRAQVALQATALGQVAYDCERRATALSYFLAEQQDTVKELAESRLLTSYFENQALGMSPEYGLQASRLLVTGLFDEVRQAKRLGEQPMYERFAFIDASGRLLNDSRATDRPWPRRDGRGLLAPGRAEPALHCEREAGELRIILSVPAFFKGRYSGQVLGWISFAQVYGTFLGGKPETSRFPDVVFFRNEALHVPESARPFLAGGQLPPLGELRPGQPFPVFGAPGDARTRFAHGILMPVKGTPFSILTFIPSSGPFDFRSPRHLLYATGGFALLLIAGLFALIHLYTRYAILRTHLEETLLRERAVDDKNRELAAEIRERRLAEAEREKLQVQLLQAQKMESLGSLAGGIAHDMNNVLGAILGLASARQEDPAPDARAHRAFTLIAEAAARGGRTVQSLLSFARQHPSEERVLDLNALLGDMVALLEHTTLARVRLELDLAEGLRPVRGDANALTHAFMNLCVNAVDAMPEQGLLRLRTRNAGEREVEVQVEDTGSGMSTEVLNRAMDPFYTTKPTGKGTGLGLSLVYSTIRAHGGELELQSEPGVGTRVVLRLPAWLI